MDSKHFHIAVVFLVASLLAVSSAGCENETQQKTPPKPWSFDSSKAPYSVRVPGEWNEASPEQFNEFADLAVTLDDSFYLIVIPQKLPQYEGVESPNTEAVKRASLGLFRKRIDQFELEREGPVELDGEPSLTVFAEGMHGGEPVQYVATYATRGGWGYQIVAWGPQEQEDNLVAATDALLDGWKFKGKTPTDKPSGEADAGKE